MTALKILIVAITTAIHTAAVAQTVGSLTDRPETSGPETPGAETLSSEAPGSKTHRIAISYEQPDNQAHNRLRDLLVEARVLEQVQEILSAFRLPKVLPISIESCDGESDARYLYDEERIKVCYEYIEEIWKDAPTETTAQGVAPIDAIVGPLADVFFHEFGHALIDLQKIPVLGRDEYAADTVSAMLMLRIAKEDPRRLIMGAAYWYTDDLETTVTFKPTELSEIHGTPHQRFFNLMCIAYGANQEIFGDLVERGYLPEDRAEDCKSEFEQAQHAFNLLIRPHMDQTLANAAFAKRWLPNANIQPPPLSQPDSGAVETSTSTVN